MKKPNQKASILITTLWIMAILSLLAVGIGFRASIELRLARYQKESLEAKYLAKAGVEKAKIYLAKSQNVVDNLYTCGIGINLSQENMKNSKASIVNIDLNKFIEDSSTASLNENAETQTLPGGSPEEIFGETANKLGEGSFGVYVTEKSETKEGVKKIYGMIDEERKININFSKIPLADKQGELKRILRGLSANMTEEIINAIIDWQDSDTITSFPGGAENFDYEAEKDISCKNNCTEDFKYVEELLLVKGMTLEIFHEIENNVTVYTDGKININTAPKEVLNALFNDKGGTYQSLIDKILSLRQGADKIDATVDDGMFTSLNELKNITENILEKNRIDILSPYLTFKSNVFKIDSHGKAGKVEKIVTRVVIKGQENEELKTVYAYAD